MQADWDVAFASPSDTLVGNFSPAHASLTVGRAAQCFGAAAVHAGFRIACSTVQPFAKKGFGMVITSRVVEKMG